MKGTLRLYLHCYVVFCSIFVSMQDYYNFLYLYNLLPLIACCHSLFTILHSESFPRGRKLATATTGAVRGRKLAAATTGAVRGRELVAATLLQACQG